VDERKRRHYAKLANSHVVSMSGRGAAAYRLDEFADRRLRRSPLGGHRHLRASGSSLDDAILEVRDAGRFDRPELLELEVGAEAVEEPRAAAEYQRDDVQLELVDESRRQVFVDRTRAAADDGDVAVGRDRDVDPDLAHASVDRCRQRNSSLGRRRSRIGADAR
jgi:hypothetical protein